jgi:hypothetical protein
MGYKILEPTNIGWLYDGDPAIHYLGWKFFSQSQWQFPIGLNPNYGLDLSNSIVFSDSIPLFAIFFKNFYSHLSNPFQYFGIWILFCLLLQGWFGWKLSALISNNIYIKIAITTLLIFSPPMLARMDGHLSLVAHFLILAAIYLRLTPESRHRDLHWGILLMIAALIHAYLLAMTAYLWVNDIIARLLLTPNSIKKLFISTAAIITVTILSSWQAGYFTIHDGIIADGYGANRLNLLSPFISNHWSYFFPSIPSNIGDGEGFNFLGTGIIFLMILLLPYFLKCKLLIAQYATNSNFLVLGVGLFFLFLFSLSNNIGISTFNFSYPIPPLFEGLANTFRSSGRMFWPVFYCLDLLIIYLIVKCYKKNISIALLILAVLIQMIDTNAGWADTRAKYMAEPITRWNTSLDSPTWDCIVKNSQKILYIPPGNNKPYWKEIAYLASNNKIPTDAVFLARIDNKKLIEYQKNSSVALAKELLDANAIYLADDIEAFKGISSNNTFTINGLHIFTYIDLTKLCKIGQNKSPVNQKFEKY